jgi:intein/homing endonuclease
MPNRKTKDFLLFTHKMMRLIGYYLSGGYSSGSSVLNFSLNKNEKENISEIKSLLLSITSKKPNQRIRGNVIEIRICSKKWVDFFESVAGHYAACKKLSDEIMLLPFKKQWEMIETYIKGDGNVYKRRPHNTPTYRITTASRNLAIQIQEILARGGIFSSIKVDKRPRNYIEGRKVNAKPLYEISFKLKRKNNFFHTNGKYFLIPIRKIEKNEFVGKVYNFHVEGKPESYLVKGFAVHNCAAAVATSSMITEMAKGKTLEEALKITREDVGDALDGLPPIKQHCSNLAAEALHKAIEDYRNKK